MPHPKSDPGTDEPAPTTPGRPNDSGSRQQRVPDQTIQSGSPSLDKEATQRSGKVPASIPSH